MVHFSFIYFDSPYKEEGLLKFLIGPRGNFFTFLVYLPLQAVVRMLVYISLSSLHVLASFELVFRLFLRTVMALTSIRTNYVKSSIFLLRSVLPKIMVALFLSAERTMIVW